MGLTIPELIRKKRDGFELEAEELELFVNSVIRKDIDESQIGAMLMAMYLNKQSFEETMNLTRAMIRTGEPLSFEGLDVKSLVDKHSTGGVGDKVSIILAPALAACGLKVPMISGRALGFTGGTLDKLESIPGFQTRLDLKQMNECLAKSGCFICGTTASLAPADSALYKYRDVTCTVEDPNLIAASILSKKASEGIGALVIDVKFGTGSAFRSEEEAVTMATLLRELGKGLDLDIKVIISEMNAPLGKFVGNALEVVEAIMCLRNEIQNSVTELVKLLGGIVLESKGLVATLEEGKQRIEKTLENSGALECFFRMLVSQGVSEKRAEDLCSGKYWKVLERARQVTRIESPKKGVVGGIDAGDIGKACWELGAGRVQADSRINHSVGVVLLKDIGEEIEKGECWIEVHHSDENLPPEAESLIRKSLIVKENCAKNVNSGGPVRPLPAKSLIESVNLISAKTCGSYSGATRAEGQSVICVGNVDDVIEGRYLKK